jgi:hypothetical protein
MGDLGGARQTQLGRTPSGAQLAAGLKPTRVTISAGAYEDESTNSSASNL